MGRRLKLLQFDDFFDARDIFFIFLEKTRQIEAWNINIAWLTPTWNTIYEWAMGFRYGNFFITWVEITLKLAHGKEKLTSRRPTALGRKAFLPVG
jgi:hypothetical protein